MRFVLLTLLLAAACEDEHASRDECPARPPSGTCDEALRGNACFYPSDGGRLICDCSYANLEWSCWPEGSGIDSAL